MKIFAVLTTIILCCLCACNKTAAPFSPSTPASSTATPPKPPDAVQQRLTDYAGVSATDCGRLDVRAASPQSKAASDCAMQASQSKHPFYVAYDMPGMIVGVAGDAAGKLLSVQSQGEGPAAAVTSGDCPSQLRIANSGRVTCFAPSDMGSMGSGHTAIPPGMPDPHAFPKQK